MRTCFLGLTWVQPPVLTAVPHSGSLGTPAHSHSDPQTAALWMVDLGQVPVSCWRKGLRVPFPGAMRLAEWL